MKMIWDRRHYGDELTMWFCRVPLDGPAFVGLTRIGEAMQRLIRGEQHWLKAGSQYSYRSLLDDGSER